MIYLELGLLFLWLLAIILKKRTILKNDKVVIGLLFVTICLLVYFCYNQLRYNGSVLFIDTIDTIENIDASAIEIGNVMKEIAPNGSEEIFSIDVENYKMIYGHIKNHLPKIVSGLIVTFIAMVLKTSVIHQYCNKMEQVLFELNHKWLKDKELSEIMLSVEVSLDDSIEEWDICEYFQNRILKNETNIYFVLGNPGEGKTVALHKVAKMLLDNYQNRRFNIYKLFYWILKKIKKVSINETEMDKIPILLNFSEIKSITEMSELQNHIKNHIYKIANLKNMPFLIDKIRIRMDKTIERNLNQGKFVILLDGYDEITEEKRYELAQLINKYRKINNQTFFVVASRTVVMKNEKYFDVTRDRALNLVPLSKEKILEFLSSWNFRSPKLYWELYEKILANHQLENLAKNPLLLTLICYLFDVSQLHMPQNITEFYKAGMKCLLESWEKEKKIFKTLKIDYEVKLLFLEKTAFYLYNKGEDNFEKIDLFCELKELNDLGVQVKSIFDEIYFYSGLIEKTSDQLYRFSHRSFYEFFLARYLARNKNMLTDILNEKEAYQIALFYFGLTEGQEEIKEYILLNFDKLDLVERLIIECQIKDVEIVKSIVLTKIQNFSINENQSFYRNMGIIAEKYKVVQAEVETLFIQKFKEYIGLNKTEKLIYIIMGLSYFKEQNDIVSLIIESMGKIDLCKLAKNCNLRFEQCLIGLFQYNINKKEKEQILKGLGESGQYSTIMNIFRKVNVDDNDMLIFYQMIHETKKEAFIQWLDKQKLEEYVDTRISSYAEKWKREYGWKWISDIDSNIQNRYILVCYFLKHADNNKLNYKLISNRIKFVASYITSKEIENIPKAYYIDIPNCTIVSNVEFQYHWKKTKFFQKILYNNALVKSLQWSVAVLALALICFQITYIHSEYNSIYDKCYAVMKSSVEVANMNIYNKYLDFMNNFEYNFSISNFFETNSIFIYIYLLWTGLQVNSYKYYYEKPFSVMYNIFYMALMSGFLAVFFLLFQDNVFRLLAVVVAFIIFLLELSQHKNNMPSFRGEQFQLIKEYLEKDIL